MRSAQAAFIAALTFGSAILGWWIVSIYSDLGQAVSRSARLVAS